MNTIARRRDPFWDMDGRSARRERTLRRLLLIVVALLATALLAMILARLPTVDVRELIVGPQRSVVVGALLADVAACLMIVAGRLRQPAG